MHHELHLLAASRHCASTDLKCTAPPRHSFRKYLLQCSWAWRCSATCKPGATTAPARVTRPSCASVCACGADPSCTTPSKIWEPSWIRCQSDWCCVFNCFSSCRLGHWTSSTRLCLSCVERCDTHPLLGIRHHDRDVKMVCAAHSGRKEDIHCEQDCCCVGILSGLLGASVGSHRPVSAMLTEAYGDSILQFHDGRWQRAYDLACQQGKPLLVYLHSDSSPVRHSIFL